MAGDTVVFEMEKFLMAKRRRPDGKRRTSEPLPADAVKAVFDAAAGNPHDPRAVPRGKFIGTRVGGEPENEADNFDQCGCGAWVDCRDLGQVLEHVGPYPHPSQDQPQ